MNLNLELEKLKETFNDLTEINKVDFQYVSKIGLWPTKTIKLFLYIQDKKEKIRKVEVIQEYIKDNIIMFDIFMKEKDRIFAVYVDEETYGLRSNKEVMKSNIYFSYKKGYSLKNIDYLREKGR